jgi:preprotein translocase subunit SecG
MIYLLVTLHVLVCFFLIIVVLLQSGKAADLAGAFGGMGSQTAFGPRGAATVLSKATTVAAVIFMLTSITLSIYATRRGGGGATSVLDSEKASSKKTTPAKTSAPVAPTPAPVAPGTAGSPVNIELTPQGSDTKSSGNTIKVPVAPPGTKPQAPAQGQPAGKK